MKKINKILIIDDSDDDNFFHSIIIKKMDITERIDTCFDGVDALDYFNGRGRHQREEEFIFPDLIFIDINMPRMNGWELLDEYAAIKASFSKEPVLVLLTTSLNPSDQRRTENYGLAIDFLSKPLTQESLSELCGKYFPELSVD